MKNYETGSATICFSRNQTSFRFGCDVWHSRMGQLWTCRHLEGQHERILGKCKRDALKLNLGISGPLMWLSFPLLSLNRSVTSGVVPSDIARTIVVGCPSMSRK